MIMNIMQILLDTGLNAFGAKLLAESWDSLDPKVKAVVPKPLVFTLGNCEITLRDSLQSTTPAVAPETHTHDFNGDGGRCNCGARAID